MTCRQLSKRLGVVHATVRSSVRALKEAGFVTGESQWHHGRLGRAENLYRVREGIYKSDTSLQQAVDLLKRYRAISPQPGELYLDNNEFLATQP
jgi:predicted ArsR family transcriptional regulator